MELTYLYAIITAFGAGILALLSPCVYPLLPVTLGYFGVQADTGRRARVVLFSMGQWLTFTVLGLLAVWAGESLGVTAQIWWVQVLTGVFFLAFGIASLRDWMPAFLNKINLNSRMANGRSSAGALVLGASSALLVSPCTTPILGAVLTSAALQPTVFRAAGVMSSFSAGFTSLLLIVGLGLVSLKKFPRSGPWLRHLHIGASWLILVAGVWYLYLGASAFLGS